MNGLTRHHLGDATVLIEEGFRGLVSHPLKFKRWVIFIVCFSDLFGELEVIISSSRTCFHKFYGRTVVIVNVAAHWHEHHQCAQQQRNPDTAEDGFLLVFLVSQHVSFTPYGLYALHPTTYTIYRSWGAICLKTKSRPRDCSPFFNTNGPCHKVNINKNLTKKYHAIFLLLASAISPSMARE